MSALSVLVIDDERPALDELAFLLDRDPRIGTVLTSDSATDALRILHEEAVDAVFLDISMPGLTGLELAQVLARFKEPPPVVFVTAHEQHAVDAFELNAVDYVLKPVREDRLTEAVRRVVEGSGRASATRTSRSPSSSAGAPGSCRARTSPTSRRTVTTRGCTPARARTWSAPRSARSRRSGVRPGSSGSTVRCWSPSRTSRRSAPSTAGRRWWSTDASSWSAAGTRASCVTCSSDATGPVGRERPPAPDPGAGDRADDARPSAYAVERAPRDRRAQTEVGLIFLRSLLRSQLRLAATVLGILATTVVTIPVVLHLLPDLAGTPVLGMPLAWVLLAFGIHPVLLALGVFYVRRAERIEDAFADVLAAPATDGRADVRRS